MSFQGKKGTRRIAARRAGTDHDKERLPQTHRTMEEPHNSKLHADKEHTVRAVRFDADEAESHEDDANTVQKMNQPGAAEASEQAIKKITEEDRKSTGGC